MITNKERRRWSLLLLWVLLTILCIPMALVIDFGLRRILVRFMGDFIYV